MNFTSIGSGSEPGIENQTSPIFTRRGTEPGSQIADAPDLLMESWL